MAKADKKYVQKSHFLDTRIQDLIAKIEHEGIPPTFGTEKCAEILGCSTQWIEIGRSRGYGPPYTKVSNRMVRYTRTGLLEWLAERTVYRRELLKARARKRNTEARAA